MIYSLTGKIIQTENDLAVIECGGVGYGCRTTYHTLQQIAGRENVTLYTHLVVKEDDVSLYGFSSKEERKCFVMLISVSGVGPKAALAILSSCTPSQFALFVASGDYKSLSKAKGVGAKTAQKIVIELKDKIAKENSVSVKDMESFASSEGKQSAVGEAVSALVVLGYSESEARAGIKGVDPSLPVEEIIKAALKNLAKF